VGGCGVFLFSFYFFSGLEEEEKGLFLIEKIVIFTAQNKEKMQKKGPKKAKKGEFFLY